MLKLYGKRVIPKVFWWKKLSLLETIGNKLPNSTILLKHIKIRNLFKIKILEPLQYANGVSMTDLFFF